MNHPRTPHRSGSLARIVRLVVASALLVLAAPVALATAGGAGAEPAPGTCPTTVVQRAELVRTVDGPRLQVRGTKAHADTFVRLEPEQIDYEVQPDFWRWFAVGCGGTGPVVKTPYTQLFPVPTYPVGRLGIVIGPSLVHL